MTQSAQSPERRCIRWSSAMKLVRRQFLRLAGAAVAAPVFSRIACAQAYPTRPVRIIIGFPAGSAVDVVARLIGQWLSDRLHQPFIVESKPGAGTNIAAEAVVRAPADGHTLLWVTGANTINATLYEKLNFDFIRDIAPVAPLVRSPQVMAVNPSVPAKTIPEFIAYAKANPGKINMASSGIGATSHLAGELFKMMTGVEMVHVPYRGSPPGLTDLLGGQVQGIFVVVSDAIEHIRAGRIRALGVTTATRLEALPGVPAVGEFVLDYEVSGWQGVGAPKNTPSAIIDRLNNEINAGLADPTIKARLSDLAYMTFSNSPADFGKFITADIEKMGKVIRAANIRVG
jgi:tripartite-type tricarboxylate transporter receptor subunit TctC